jgi:predicted nucleic acid-binding protein
VPSADRIYVDPSALRGLYVHDERSARFCRWRKRVGGALPITRFGRSELENSVELAVHRGFIDRSVAQAATLDLEADLEEGRLALVDVLWRKTLDLSVDLSRRYTARLGTRSLDVLHVASAVMLETRQFVTYDGRQAALARATGLKLVAP